MKLRKHLKRYSDLYLINILTIISGIVFYFFDRKPEIPIAIFATGISISFGFRQYKIENDKMFKELFQTFNEKYDLKFNNELNNIEQITKKDSNYNLTEMQVALVMDYLNLCAEEYLWYTKGRIDETVWKSWEKGMKFYINIKSIKKVVETQKAQKDSFYGLFEKLKIE
jgi:hypothetical protein